jgi:hypothetical protein
MNQKKKSWYLNNLGLVQNLCTIGIILVLGLLCTLPFILS